MRTKSTTSRILRTLAGAFALAMAGAILTPTSAYAAFTAANTNIINQATIGWQDLASNAFTAVTNQVTVTVSLVQAAPNISAATPVNPTINQGSGETLTYYISSNANGPDTYVLSYVNTPTNIGLPTGTTLSTASVSLGATTLAVAATNFTGTGFITVPYDGHSHVAGSVNGLTAGDTIWVGGGAALITAVGPESGPAEPGYAGLPGQPGTGNQVVLSVTTISTNGICQTSCGIGTPVGQSMKFTWLFTASGVVTAPPSGTYAVTTSGQASNAGPTGTSTVDTITVLTSQILATKMVSIDGGVTFNATATAAPHATLLYRITASNTGLGAVQDVYFSDVLPEYLSYVTGQAKFATYTAGGTIPAYSAATGLTEGTGGFSFTSPNISYNPTTPQTLCGTTAGAPAACNPLPSPNISAGVLYYEATVN